MRIIVIYICLKRKRKFIAPLFHHKDGAPGIARLSKLGTFELVGKYSNILALFFRFPGKHGWTTSWKLRLLEWLESSFIVSILLVIFSLEKLGQGESVWVACRGEVYDRLIARILQSLSQIAEIISQPWYTLSKIRCTIERKGQGKILG